MRRAAGILALAAVLVVVASLAPAARAASRGSAAANSAGPASWGNSAAPVGTVVVVAVPGLRWSDVDPSTTPALARLTSVGAIGALSVKAGPDVSCAADGLLTLLAGGRATAYGAPCGSSPTDPVAVARRNLASREQADVRVLVRAVTAGGGCLATTGPLSGLVGSGPSGSGPSGSGPNGAGPSGAGTGSRPCVLTVRTTGPVGGTGADRRGAAHAVDVVVAEADAARPTGSTMLVLGTSEAPGDRVAHLHVALAVGPGLDHGTLTSASTRRLGYVQLIDVTPTVLATLGLPVPRDLPGQPFTVHGSALSTATLVDLDDRAVAQKRVTVPFFVVTIAGSLLLLCRRRWRPRAALVAAGLPAGSFLAGVAPWWSSGVPLLALLVTSTLFALLLALVGERFPGRFGPAGAVCAATVLVLAGDLVTGAYLQITSPAGYSPLVAGRFAGIGNVAFGVYAAAGLLATAWLARGRLVVVAGGGLVLVAVDGAPPWGSDVGGVLALLPALVLLGLLVSGRRVSVVRLGLAGVAGAVVVTVLALADHARGPAAQTHLGRFVTQVQDGTAGTVLRRKADAVFGLLFHSPVTALLPVVVVAAAYLLVRPPPPLAASFARVPELRHGLVALGLACALGFALNDSGAAVPALALLVALPVATAVTVRPG